ncbi:hypothetical protein PInf_021654 [Phytophthora infestans]|nr:hypothetical protein PInf_021654 [Phytophthora infestans]
MDDAKASFNLFCSVCGMGSLTMPANYARAGPVYAPIALAFMIFANTYATLKLFRVLLVSPASVKGARLSGLCCHLRKQCLVRSAHEREHSTVRHVPLRSRTRPIDKMCASTACNTLLADVKAMNLEECQLPVGVGSNLKADLVVYVPSNCPSTSAPSPDSPATNAPVVDTPTTPDNSTNQAEHTAALTASSDRLAAK